MNSILVSICCITYNHEPYIADAIESFLMQETDFEYEILIGEDCSTDRTRAIVEEYVLKYPNKVKLITSDTNVGTAMNSLRLQEKAVGKYVALCEGDDYWTDPRKLQKQIAYMEAHPECSMCFHAAEFVNSDKTPTGKIARIAKESKVISINQICSKAKPKYIPTAARVFRKEIMDNPPEWFIKACIGDFPSALIMAHHGHVYYIDEIMSAYRIGVSGSWTSRNIGERKANHKNIKVNFNCIEILECFNKYSGYKYVIQVNKAKLERVFEIFRLKLRELKSNFKLFKL